MRSPDFLVCRRPAPPRRQDRTQIGKILSGDEQLHESRMCDVVGLQAKHQLGVRRHVDVTCTVAVIRDRDAPNLGVILGRDEHFQLCREGSIPPGVFGPVFVERDFIVIGLGAARLEAGRPNIAAVNISEVDERAPVVAGGILTPARYGKAPPTAVARTGGRQHHRVTSVGQKVSGRRRSVWGGQAPAALWPCLPHQRIRLCVRGPGTHHGDVSWRALLQQ